MNMDEWANEQGFSLKYLFKGFIHQLKNDGDFAILTALITCGLLSFPINYFTWVSSWTVWMEVDALNPIVVFIFQLFVMFIAGIFELIVLGGLCAGLVSLWNQIVKVANKLNKIGAKESYREFSILNDKDNPRRKKNV